MSTYRADVDGLRAVAVLAVVLYHAFPGTVPGGFIGVDVFFVISGYLISGIIFDGLRDGTFSFRDFYARRVRRIFPALAMVLAATLAAGWLLLVADRYRSLGTHAAGGAAFAANFTFWYESGYFDPSADTKPLLHLWSLGVEEQFYLVWPLLALIASRMRSRPLLVAGVLAASLLLNIDQVRRDPVGTFYSPLTRFWELMAGAMLVNRPALAARTGDVAGVAGLAAIISAALALDPSRLFPGLWALLPVGGTALLIAAGERAIVNRVLLARPALVGIGLISYPLYLWHWPLLSFARIANLGTPPIAMRIALIGAAFALASLTYQAIERPVRFGRWRAGAVPALATAMCAVAALGLIVFARDGVRSRPINFATRASFVQAVQDFRDHGLAGAYRLECDFSVRNPIDAACTEPGSGSTWFLWGDSHAQALAPGLATLLPSGGRLAQVATSSCRPLLAAVEGDSSICATSNAFALASIGSIKPSVVILAQAGLHESTDWDALAARLRALGVKRVLLIGPLPMWKPNLPEVVAAHHWNEPFDRVAEGLVLERIELDRGLEARLGRSSTLTYVSLMTRLCDSTGCTAKVPGGPASDVLAWDDSHLTLRGSAYLARTILAPFLRF